MMEERLRVLRAMNEVTAPIDLNGFARMVNLTPEQALAHMVELERTGFARKKGAGFGITEKGLIALRALTPVPKEMAFHFYTEVGQPTGFSAQTLMDFYEIVKRVPAASLEFHLYREDFEKWVRAAFSETALAEEVASLKRAGLKGENLRQALLTAVQAKFPSYTPST